MRDDHLEKELFEQINLRDEFDAEIINNLQETNFSNFACGIIEQSQLTEFCSEKITPPLIVINGDVVDDRRIISITKPIKLSNLFQQLKTLILLREYNSDSFFRFANFEFYNIDKSLVNTTNGEIIRLTEKEADIIKYLYNADGCVVSRDELLHHVWNYNEHVTTHTLETHIYRLRQKTETDPNNAKVLITDIGGYKLSIS